MRFIRLNDAERLAIDPVMRQVVGGHALVQAAASTSHMARFETEVLTQPQNLATLMALPDQWVDRVRHGKPIMKLILDLDRSVSETYGQQEGSAYNGHFGCECYHPLFASIRTATPSGHCCAMATSPALTTGARCWCR